MSTEKEQLNHLNTASSVSPATPSDIRVSILIKALNEEEKIARCLAAAVQEIESVGGEIILVDSLSTDRTVEIASTFPVRIVQFENKSDCSCGAATQLGYQYALGQYLYLLDGDMELQPGFIAHGIEYLEKNTSVAGVGGLIIDTRTVTPDDKRRAKYYASVNDAIFVEHLGGGGLFRREAIASIDYIANRWLKVCEEVDLGNRLSTVGWQLVRLPEPAVKHTGHNESGFGMLCRLWRNGRMRGHGELLRSALGYPWFWANVQYAWFLFAAPAVYLAIIVFSCLLVNIGIDLFSALLSSITSLWSLIFLLLWKKKHDAKDALIAIFSWHLYIIAAIPGFLKKNMDPHQLIISSEIK